MTAVAEFDKDMEFVATTKEAAEKCSKLGKTYLAEDADKTADVLYFPYISRSIFSSRTK